MFFSSKKKIKKRRDSLCKEADIFIQVHFVRERNSEKYKFNTLSLKSDPERDKVNEWYNAHNNPENYSEIVLAYYNDLGKDSSDLFEKGILEKDYFTKLEKSLSYVPSKGEAVIVCFAFKLSLEASRALLKSADYALSNSEKTDLVIRYFLENNNYNIHDLNYVLIKICDIKLRDIV